MNHEKQRLTPSEWSTLKTQLIWVYQNHQPIASNCDNISGLNNYSVWFIHCGCVNIKVGNRPKLTIPENHWVIPPPSISRSQFFPTHTHISSINFIAEWPAARHLVPFDQVIAFPYGTNGEFDISTARLFERTSIHHDLYASTRRSSITCAEHLASTLAFTEWLTVWLEVMESFGYLPQLMSPLDDRLTAALLFLDTHSLGERDIYSRLTKIMGLSRTQIDRLFRTHLATTPKKYIEQRLLREVIEQLQLTTKSIKELAIEFGFSSSAHLCAWFKRQTGHRPKTFSEN